MQKEPQNYPYIPDQAFLYFPSGFDLKKGQGKQTKRFVFSGQIQFTPFENQQLQKLNQSLQKQKINLNQYWNKGLKLRFLQANQYDVKKAISQIIEHSVFVRQNQNLNITHMVQHYLKAGVVYYSGRDSRYRPIVVFDAKKMIDMKIKVNQFYQVMKYFNLFLINNLMIDGQIQNMVCIADLGYSNVISMATTMKEGIVLLSKHFKARNFKTFVVNCPPSISFIWSIAKSFLNQDQKSKVNFMDKSIVDPLLDYSHHHQIQEKYGGKRPNITQFWPPSDYSSYYQPEEKQQVKLIKISKYQEMFLNGKLKGRKINKRFIDQILQLNQQKQELNQSQLRNNNMQETQFMTTEFQQTIIKSEQKIIKKHLYKYHIEDIVHQELPMDINIQFQFPLSFY